MVNATFCAEYAAADILHEMACVKFAVYNVAQLIQTHPVAMMFHERCGILSESSLYISRLKVILKATKVHVQVSSKRACNIY